MSSDVLISQDNHLARLTLNRPDAMNSLSLDMVRTLATQLQNWQHDDNVHAVLIDSSTPKAFCAGGDIHFFHEVARAGLSGGSALLEDFFTEEYALNHLIHHYKKPYLAILDGIVMGGGMGITQSSAPDCIRIITERTRMAMPEVKIGLFPDVGGGYFLSRLPGEIGTYLGLTGEIITAADALYTGFAHIFIPRKNLPELLAALSAVNNQNYKTTITTFAAAFASQINPEESMLAKHRASIDRHFCHDKVIDIIASLKGDSEIFAQKTLESMLQRSPLMVAVTLEQIRRARDMTVAECLRMERTMVRRCFEDGEVVEGIRALAINKDQQPCWKPSSFDQVTPEMIAPFFTSAWPAYAHPLRTLG